MGILTRFCIFKLKWSWAKRGELDIFMLFCSLFCHLNLFIYRWKVHKQFTTRFYAKNLQDWRMKFEKKFRICQNSTWARLMQNSHSSDWRAEKESLRMLTGSRRPALAEFLFFFLARLWTSGSLFAGIYIYIVQRKKAASCRLRCCCYLMGTEIRYSAPFSFAGRTYSKLLLILDLTPAAIGFSRWRERRFR